MIARSALVHGSLLQRLRIVTGLILFAFVMTHLLNHALGLVSLEAMHAMQGWRTALTRSPVGGVVLFGAMAMHLLLNLWRIAERRHWRMPIWEALQIASGVLIPLLLIPHLIGMRVGHELFAKDTSYGATIGGLWTTLAWNQIALVGIVWLHGCIGIHNWLKLADWYRLLQPLALALAIALPLVAIAGFSVAGRQQAALTVVTAEAPSTGAASGDDYGRPAAGSRNGDGDAPLPPPQTPPRSRDGYGEAPADAVASASNLAQASWSIALIQERGIVAYLLLLALLPAALVGRVMLRRDQRRFAVSYIGGRTVTAHAGPTLLEISRAAGIPHTAVCGGRARCSTCRVRVFSGRERLPQAAEAEVTTLLRIGAPPEVRLACQLRPTHDLSLLLLVSPDAPQLVRGRNGITTTHGAERALAVMFLDVRGFTRLSQSRLPYDVVFVLNRLFAHLGAAIQAEGGWIDKYLGDGLMAVFGRDGSFEEGCRQALAAARALDLALEQANHGLTAELGEPVAIGIGIHAGPMILGEIGHRDSAAVTVIGRTVNAAARLEQATKDLGVQLIVSVETLRVAGVATEGLSIQTLAVRGLDDPVSVLALERARDLTPPG